jgi:C_GCAxxG_C_C family probable redox protein
MSQNKVLGEKASSYFLKGYNCAQSVLLTMFEHWNGKNKLVPKIATGGIMALSVRFGTNEPSSEKRKKAYELACAFYRSFEKQNGSVLCRELIGYDLSDSEELEKAHEAKVFEEKCSVFVKKTVELLLELSESPP